MTVLVIVLVALAALFVGLFVGGLIANRRRYRTGSNAYGRHVAEADRALEEARAADRGWDRSVLEEVARRALADQRPDSSYDELRIVLVDDQPGVEEDRAQMLAFGEGGETCRLSLTRQVQGTWTVDAIE